MIKGVFFSVVTLVAMAGIFTLPVEAVANKITICHATSSDSNPFVVESVDDDAIVKGNAHDEHQDAEDIIPSFTYEINDRGTKTQATYPGRNWTSAGQAIWNNGCNPVTTPDDEEEEEEEEVDLDSVTLCHGTNSATNPYVKITVSVDAAGTFKDNGNGDHAQHTGPVATSEAVANGLKDDKIQWGDIIPAGDYNTAVNWTAEGQAIFNNDCNYATPGQGTTPDEPTTPVTPGSGSVPTPVTPAAEVEALPVTSGDRTFAYTLIAAGLATVVTGIVIGINSLYRRSV